MATVRATRKIQHYPPCRDLSGTCSVPFAMEGETRDSRDCARVPGGLIQLVAASKSLLRERDSRSHPGGLWPSYTQGWLSL